jgi:hypothetical protein
MFVRSTPAKALLFNPFKFELFEISFIFLSIIFLYCSIFSLIESGALFLSVEAGWIFLAVIGLTTSLELCELWVGSSN